jgi:hypothetical protein
MFDFLWQNAIWVVVGLALSKAWRWSGTHLSRWRLRSFFGADALGEVGIVVTAPVLKPLSRDNFNANAEVTTALKSDESGEEVRLPVYGEVLHLADYESAEEIFALLRKLGAKRTRLLQDSKALGTWQENPCMVCLGSPFMNATLGELLGLARDEGNAPISGNRASKTLDTYRLLVREPDSLTLGVDQQHALGVIVRLANRKRPSNWVIGVWGDRAESTYAAASYLRREFKAVAVLAEKGKPLTVVLSIRGLGFKDVSIMYAATDRELSRDQVLLDKYDRSAADAQTAGAAAVDAA